MYSYLCATPRISQCTSRSVWPWPFSWLPRHLRKQDGAIIRAIRKCRSSSSANIHVHQPAGPTVAALDISGTTSCRCARMVRTVPPTCSGRRGRTLTRRTSVSGPCATACDDSIDRRRPRGLARRCLRWRGKGGATGGRPPSLWETSHRVPRCVSTGGRDCSMILPFAKNVASWAHGLAGSKATRGSFGILALGGTRSGRKCLSATGGGIVTDINRLLPGADTTWHGRSSWRRTDSRTSALMTLRMTWTAGG